MSDLHQSVTSTPDDLIAGPMHAVVVPIVVVAAEGELPRGSVLGKITATGKYALVNSAGADDGRRTAAVILAEDIDATLVDVTTTAYDMGEFNENALTFGGTDTVATHKATLQGKNIYVRPAVAVD
jgi:hypothetical protein